MSQESPTPESTPTNIIPDAASDSPSCLNGFGRPVRINWIEPAPDRLIRALSVAEYMREQAERDATSDRKPANSLDNSTLRVRSVAKLPHTTLKDTRETIPDR